MVKVVKRSRLVFDSEIKSPLGQVSLAGHFSKGRGIPMDKMRTFGRYALVYLLDGSGQMKWGRQAPESIRAGDLLFVYPEIPHAYGPRPGEHWTEFFVVFEGPVFDLWRKAGSLQPQWPIQHLPQIKRWLPRLEAVVARGPSATPTGMLRRVCRLQQFLSDIAKEPAPEAVTHAWLAKAQQRLLDTPNAEAAQVARELGLSYETFRKEFARETGLPPARYQLRRRIDQARRLITERHLTNKEIAEALGFYDEFHFSRRFREATGQSTRAFRQGVR